MTQQGATGGSEPKAGIVIPVQEITGDSFLDSVLQILSQNIGAYVILEFLVGTNTIVGRQGILEFVGPSYVVLHDDTCQAHIIGDLAALRFVTICFGEEGENGAATPGTAAGTATGTGQVSQEQATPTPAPRTLTGTQPVSANARTHSQAAFNYAKRKTRR